MMISPVITQTAAGLTRFPAIFIYMNCTKATLGYSISQAAKYCSSSALKITLGNVFCM